MIKLLGPGNDLMDQRGRITKWGYGVLLLSSVFGFGCFLAGRALYGKSRKGD